MADLTFSNYQFSGVSESITGEKITHYVMRVKDLAENEKPREKLISSGPAALSVQELVVVLLGYGTKKEEIMAMSGRVLKEYGERSVINESSPRNLAETLNIPLPKACQLVASFELGRRFFENRTGKAVYISTAQQAFDYLKEMGYLKKEILKGLYLNSRYKVIYEEVISIGSLTSNIVHPREIFRPAIEHGAAAVIIAHNHPSGSLAETGADVEATERLLASAGILGIDLLDHLIIAGDKYKSIIAQD